MPNWLKNTLALIAGVFLGGLSLGLLETLVHQIVDGEGRFVVAALSLGIAAALGGVLALFIGRTAWLAWGVGVILFALSGWIASPSISTTGSSQICA